MAKVGRNDPCPCGSGKKYKQCCLSAPATLSSRLPEVIRNERVKAEAVARRWLGQDDDGAAPPLLDRKGKKLRLVLDRFLLESPDAVRDVRALGKSDGERVLFYDGAQWIGEADFSVAGQMMLLTPQEELGDRLMALMRSISGLTHQERQVDELAELEGSGPVGGGQELLQFKQTFFAAWLDEPNQKLEQASPRQAAESAALRPLLVRLLAELEDKESRLPRGERFSFARLRKELGVP